MSFPLPPPAWDSPKLQPPVLPADAPPVPERVTSALPFPVWRDALGTLFGPFHYLSSLSVSPAGDAVWLDASLQGRGVVRALVRADGSGLLQPDKRSLVAWQPDGQAMVREVPAGTPEWDDPAQPPHPVRLLLLRPDGTETLLYSGPDPGRFQGFTGAGRHAVFMGRGVIGRLEPALGVVFPVAAAFPTGAPLDPEPWRRLSLSLTPDGQETVLAEGGRLYFLSLHTGEWQSQSIPGRWASGPAFSPGGDRIAFVSAPLLPNGEPDIPTNYVGSKDAAGDTLHVITRSGDTVVAQPLARPGRYIGYPLWSGDGLVRVDERQYYPYDQEGRHGAVATGTLGLAPGGFAPRAFTAVDYGVVLEPPLSVPGSTEVIWPWRGNRSPLLYRISTTTASVEPLETWGYTPLVVNRRDTGPSLPYEAASPPLFTLDGRLSQLYAVDEGSVQPLSEWMRPGGGRPAAVAGGTLAYHVPGVEGAYVRVRAATPMPKLPPPVRSAVLGRLPIGPATPPAEPPPPPGWRPPSPPVMGTPPSTGSGGGLRALQPDWQAGDWVLTGPEPVALAFRPAALVERVEFWGAATGGAPAEMTPHLLGEGTLVDGEWRFNYLPPGKEATRVWASGETGSGDWLHSQVLTLRQIPVKARQFRVVAAAEKAEITTAASSPTPDQWIGGHRLEIIDHPADLQRVLPYVEAIGGEAAVTALTGPFVDWENERLVVAFQSDSRAPIVLREFPVQQGAIYVDVMPDPGPGYAFVAAARPRRLWWEPPPSRFGSGASLYAGPGPQSSILWAAGELHRRVPGGGSFRPPDRIALDTVEQYLEALARGDTEEARSLFSPRAHREGLFPEWLTPIAGWPRVRSWIGGTGSGASNVEFTVEVSRAQPQLAPWQAGQTRISLVLVREPTGMRIEALDIRR